MNYRNAIAMLVLPALAACTQNVKPNLEPVTAHRIVKIDKEAGESIARFWLALTNASNKEICVTEIWWQERIEKVPDTTCTTRIEKVGNSTVHLEEYSNWDSGKVNLVELPKSFTKTCKIPLFVKLNFCERENPEQDACPPEASAHQTLALTNIPTALPLTSLANCASGATRVPIRN